MKDHANQEKENQNIQKKGAIAIIKPTKESRYENLIDILDEMAICSVARYSVDNINDADGLLIKSYKSEGMLADR